MLGLNKKYLRQLDQQLLLDLEKRIEHWQYFIALYLREMNLRTTPIFGSYLFKKANLLMKRSQFEAADLIYLNDLFDVSGNLYEFENFVHSFGVNINFVDFYSLMHSIPRNYRTLSKIEIPHDYSCELLEVILKTTKLCVKTPTKHGFKPGFPKNAH